MDGENQEKKEGKSRKEKFLGPYRIGKTLGTGSFGKVKLGIHKQTGQKVAIKKIPYGLNKQTSKENAFRPREASVMKLLNHPHIVALHDVIDKPEKKQASNFFRNGGGELFDYIVARGRLKEDEARRFFCQIISALDYCHLNLIIHRDLKPENLLLDANKNIKINDFGLSKMIDAGRSLYRLQTNCGSPLYSSPEIIKGESYIGPEVDIWALGVVLYAMLTGCQPWEGSTQPEQVANAAKGKYNCPAYLSPECRDVISKMITVDLKKRATIQQIREHPWTKPGLAKFPPPYQPYRRKFTKLEDIDFDIVQQLKSVGFSREEVVQGLLSNNHTLPVFYLYFLADELKKKEKERILDQLQQQPEQPASKQQQQQSPPAPKAEELRRNTVDHGAVKVPTPETTPPAVKKAVDNEKGGNLRKSWSPAEAADQTQQNAEDPEKKKSGILRFFGQKKPSMRVSEGIYPGVKSSDAASRGSAPTPTTAQTSSPGQQPKTSKKAMKNISGNFSVDTTSTKTVEEIVAELERAMKQMRMQFKESKASYKYTAKDQDSNVKLEVEICSIDKLDLIRGVKFKRLAGDIWNYKELCDELRNLMKL